MMKKTIYVYKEGAVIFKREAHLIVRIKETQVFEAPIANVESIVLFEYAQFTTQALCAAMQAGINIVYTTKSAKVIGYTYARYTERPLLKIAQYRSTADAKERLKIAQRIVAAKIHGQINTLAAYRETKNELRLFVEALENANSIAELMGFEGAAAAAYFKALGHYLKTFEFTRRDTRPAHDPVNALLNLTYMLTLAKIDSILIGKGFDSSLGYLHTSATDRSALALDLLEPFRGMLDRFVLKTLNLRVIQKDDFEHDERGCRLSNKGFHRFIASYTNSIHIHRLTEQIVERLKSAVLSEKGADQFELEDMYGLL